MTMFLKNEVIFCNDVTGGFQLFYIGLLFNTEPQKA